MATELSRPESLILRGGFILDLARGDVRQADVLVHDGLIVALSPKLGRRSGVVVDVGGLTILPGLVNAHEHLTMKRTWGPVSGQAGLRDAYLVIRAVRAALADLQAGVTTVRELGAKNHLNVLIKRAIDAKAIPGPRVLAAGAPITSTGGHTWKVSSEADGPDGLRSAVRQTIKAGADWIKLISSNDPLHSEHHGQHTHPELTASELRAAVETAHMSGVRITSHTMGRESLRWAIDAGVDSIEHGVYLNEELAASMARNYIALIPTLSGYKQTSQPSWGRGEEWAERHRQIRAAHLDSTRIAIKTGVQIGVGTDTVGDMVEELEMLVECGMSPLTAVAAATQGNSEILGLGGLIGSIEVGKVADCIVVEGNPLDRLADLKNVRLVLRGGIPTTPDEIRISTADETDRWTTYNLT